MAFVANWKQWAHAVKMNTYALYLAYRDPRTPWYAKVWAAFVVAYAFSPIDLIPDFIPVLGYLDDLVLVPLGIAVAVKLIPADVYAECKEQARSQLAHDKPVNWAAAAIVVTIWLLLALIVIAFLLQRS